MFNHAKKSRSSNKPASSSTSRFRAPRMDALEEARLARLWRTTHDTEARDRLVTANLGLVVSIAQRYRGGGVPLDELIAEGNLGLIHAVDGFDPDCGSRFSTYAAYWIRQGISRAFASDSPRGHLSGRDRRALGELERAQRDAYARTGQAPTEDELARALGWSSHRVLACRNLFRSYSRPSSLEQVRTAGRDPAAKEDPDAKRLPESADASAQVSRLLGSLSGVERAAVEMRFGMHSGGGGQPQSIEAIARALNRTRRETKSAIRGALAKMAHYARPLRLMAESTLKSPADSHRGLAAVA